MRIYFSLIITLSLLINLSFQQASWRDAYYRGIGVLPYCPTPQIQDIAGICFLPCTTGYLDSGTDCLWNTCPKRFIDNGLSCSAEGSFGRTAGYTSSGGCNSNSNGQGGWAGVYQSFKGCQMNGLFYYPVCPDGFSNIACCVCVSNGGCPAPLTGSNPNCMKPLYARAGVPKICLPGLEFGSDNLCYPPCINGYSPDNTLCFKNCPSTTCSTALCTTSASCSPTETSVSTLVYNGILTASTTSGNIDMETILNSVTGAISLAGGLTGEMLNYSQIAVNRGQPHECLKRRFPIFVGSSAGSTSVQTIQIDSTTGNIGIGGKSTDLTFLTSSANFIGLLEPSGFNFTWVAQLNIVNQDVRQIEFNNDGTKMVALITDPLAIPSPVTLLVLNLLDGTLFSSAKDATSLYITGESGINMKVDPLNNWILLSAPKTTAFELVFIGLNLFADALTTSFVATKLQSWSQKPFASDLGSTIGQIFIATKANLPQSPPLTNPQNCLAINEFSYTSAFSANYVETYFTSMSSYTPRKLKSIVLGYIGVADGPDGVLIFKKQSTAIEQFQYQESLTDLLGVLDMQVPNSLQAFILIQNTIRGKITMLTVLFSGSAGVTVGQIQITQKILKRPVLTLVDTLFAKIMPTGQFYISGRTNGMAPCMISTGIGYLAYSDDDSSCQTFTFSQGAPTLSTLTSTLTFQTAIFSAAALNPVLSNTLVSATVVPQTSLYKTPNTCCNQAITTPTMISHRYIIDYPAETYTLPPFTLNPVGINTDIYPFWYKKASTPAIPLIPSSTQEVIYFDDKLLTFNAYLETSIPDTTFKITVRGTLPNHQWIENPITYDILFFNIPSWNTIKPYSVNDVTYIVTQNQTKFSSQGFLSSDLQFYIIYYLEIFDGTSYVRSLDSEMLTFIQGGKSTEGSIYTDNNDKVGVFQFRLMGRFTPHTTFEAVSYFKIIVLHQCYLTKILPSELRKEVTYIMTSPATQPLVIQFAEWKESIGICGSFFYKLAMIDAQKPIPNYISFNPNLRQISISQRGSIGPAQFPIILKGGLNRFYMLEMQQLSIIIKCNAGILKSPQKNQVIDYIPGSPALQLQITDFIQEPMSCQKAIIYEAMLDDGQPLPVDFVQFKDQINSVGAADRRIVFKVPRGHRVQKYDIIIRATIEPDREGQKKMTSILKITVKLVPEDNYSETEYPPIYQIMKPGESWQIPFSYGSKDDDRRLLSSDVKELNITLTKSVLTYKSGELSANSVSLEPTSEPPTIFDHQSSMLTIMPHPNTVQGTRYFIQASISKAQQYLVIQSIIVIISRKGTSYDMDEEKQKMLDLLIKTKEELYSDGGTTGIKKHSIYGGDVKVRELNDIDLKMKIYKISEIGLVTIKFSKPLAIIQNVTIIDNTVLMLNTSSAYQEDERNLNFEFYTVSMSEKEMQIQLIFEEPIDISAYEIMDLLNITVIKNEFFITKQVNDTYAPIMLYSQAGKRLPRQISLNDNTDLLLSGAKAFAQGVFGIIFANAFASILLGSSLQFLWSLIHATQLFMIIPLLNISLPSNTQIIFLQLQSILSFDLVDTDNIPGYNFFFDFNEINLDCADCEQAFNSRFETYGYEYLNMIRNMGSGFVWLVLSIVYQIIVYMAWHASKAVEWKVKYIEKKEKEVFFNMIARTLYEGTLEFSICAIINLLNVCSIISSYLYQINTSNSIDIFSACFSVIILLSLATIQFLSLYTAHRVSKQNETKLTNRLTTLYDGLKTDNIHRANYHSYSMLRRTFFVITIIFLRNYTIIQIVCNLIQCIGFTVYIVKWRPFEDNNIMQLEIFNEIMLLVGAQTLFAFTDFNTTPISKYNSGWILVGVMLLTVLVNCLFALYESIKSIILTLKQKYRQFIYKRHQSSTLPIKPIDESIYVENLEYKNNNFNSSLVAPIHPRPLIKADQLGFHEMFEFQSPKVPHIKLQPSLLDSDQHFEVNEVTYSSNNRDWKKRSILYDD